MTPTTTERVVTKEPTALFTMLKHQSFTAHLIEELRLAARDFTSDPRSFVREIFSNETKDSERSKRLRLGLVFALVAQFLITGLIVALSRHTATIEKRVGEPEYTLTYLPPPPPKAEIKPPMTAVEPRAPLSPVPDVLPKGNLDKGGGGGGQNGVQEPKAGQLPQTLPIPSVVAPDTQTAPNPAVPVPGNLEGPESAPPPPDAIGSNGKNNNPGAEAGTDGGKGGGKGKGFGPGEGSGTGPGKNGNKGGGSFGIPNGETIPLNRLSGIPDSRPITWIYRATPVTTPEAQANKSVGEVWIKATFTKEGTITDIDVIREVPFMRDSAVEALKRSRFRPATIKGEPVTVTGVLIRINVHY